MTIKENGDLKLSKKLHYAWIILGCCFIIQAATTGIYNNCVSLFTPQILKEFGFSNGAFSWTMTIRALVSSTSLILVNRVFSQKTYKKIYVICATLCSLIFISQIFYTKLYQWYIENALLGFFMGFILTVPLNLILQNWFKSKGGFALGTAMAASGLSGVVINPISSFMIKNYGWRSGIILLGVISFVLIVPVVLLVLKWSPEENGMQAYYEAEESKPAKETQKRSDSKSLIIKSIIIIAIIYCITQYTYSISVFIDSLGFDVGFAALVTSAIMMGNLLGKIILGNLIDRYGAFKVMNVATVGIAISFLIFSFLTNKATLVIAGFLYGTSMSLASLMPGVIAEECFVSNIRGEVMSQMTSIATFIDAIFYLMISYSYDIFGSFQISFLFSVLLCVIVIMLSRKIEKEAKLLSD